MKKLVYLLVFCTYSAFPQNATLFEEANEAYSEGDYEEAIAKYNEILDNGQTAVAVHFNLGNAYYKINEVAPSIYHYEKALQMAPNDKDVINNLEFARKMAVDDLGEVPQNAFQRWTSGILNLLGPSGWGWASVGLMLLFSLFFILYYFSRKPLQKRIFFITGLLLLFLAIVSVFLGYSRMTTEEGQVHSIVFTEEVEVKSEPSQGSLEVFTLHEGAKVEVLEEFQGWAKIGLPNGDQGWMEKPHLKEL